MSALLGPSEVRNLAASLDVMPTKKLGQNFVHDPNTVRRIVATAALTPGEHVLEIGPGLGSLTLGLLEAGHAVTAVEIDRRLAAQLPHTVEQRQPGAPLTVVTADAMRVTELAPAGVPTAVPTAVPMGVVDAPTALVANLPYNISVPVLLHLLATFPTLRRALVMVQAEVGHRLAAAPGSKVYGGPSIKAAWYGQWRVEGQVSRQVFWPVPNVDSVLVGMTRVGAQHANANTHAHANAPGTEAERRRMGELVDAAFGQRRKMLRQSLSELYGSSAAATAALDAAGLDPTARGEQLGLADFLRLARVSAERAAAR